MMARIHQLAIYPVKSLRGFTVDKAVLTPQGFAYDRHWMIIDDQQRFVTQRKISSMVLIHTAIENGCLVLSKPSDANVMPLSIPLFIPPSIPVPNNHVVNDATITATIWKDTCQVIDEGSISSEWLAQALPTKNGKPLRLVRMASQPRPQSKPELLGEHTHTLFADAAPFLVANTASLAAVNQQLTHADIQPVTMERFRPNIVLEGLEAFTEHQIKQIQHSDYTLEHCYPCQRCVMPTVNIETGERHPQQQPFSLIADINSIPDNTKAPAFGENAILIKGEGQTVTVGDEIGALTAEAKSA